MNANKREKETLRYDDRGSMTGNISDARLSFTFKCNNAPILKIMFTDLHL